MTIVCIHNGRIIRRMIHKSRTIYVIDGMFIAHRRISDAMRAALG